MLRQLYTLIHYLLLPLIVLRMLLKSKEGVGGSRRWLERFGYVDQFATKIIWVHAVSVGEVQAASPLIKALQHAYPKYPIYITTTTVTGSVHVRRLFGLAVKHSYIPYDLPAFIRRFFSNIQPVVAIIMETEIWPNLFHMTKNSNIPLIMVNARLSEKSHRRYRRFSGLTKETLANVNAVLTQSNSDLQRFTALTAKPHNMKVMGNLKFDIEVPLDVAEQAQELKRAWGGGRPVLIAASTHEGEEDQVLEAFSIIKEKLANALLLLVPRHPERFSSVANLCLREKWVLASRSGSYPQQGVIDVFLGDTMGELPLFYAASDVVFVGGSLVPVGGHNVLEPAALKKPIIFGEHMCNFREIEALMLNAKAAIQINNAVQLAANALELMEEKDLALNLGEKAYQVVQENKGAIGKALNEVAHYINAEAS